jgi:hypothetical protein
MTESSPIKPEAESVPSWHVNEGLRDSLAWLTNVYEAEKRDSLLEKDSELAKWEKDAPVEEVALYSKTEEALEHEAHIAILENFPDRATVQEQEFGVDKFLEYLRERYQSAMQDISGEYGQPVMGVKYQRAEVVKGLVKAVNVELARLSERFAFVRQQVERNEIGIGAVLNFNPRALNVNKVGEYPFDEPRRFVVGDVNLFTGQISGEFEGIAPGVKFSVDCRSLEKNK